LGFSWRYDFKWSDFKCDKTYFNSTTPILLDLTLDTDTLLKLRELQDECARNNKDLFELNKRNDVLAHRLRKLNQEYQKSYKSSIKLMAEESFTNIFDNKNKLFEHINILEKNEDVVSKLFQAYFYARLGNTGKAIIIVNNIVKDDLLQLFYTGNFFILKSDEKKQYIKNFFYILNSLKEYLHPNLFRNLILFLYNFSNKELQTELSELTDTKLSTTQIRDLSSEYRFGLHYPAVWLPMLLSRVRLIEANQYVLKSFESMTMTDKLDNIWAISVFLPNSNELREALLAKFKNTLLNLGNDFYQNELFLFLVGHEHIYQLFVDKYKESFKPLFVYQKKHLSNCLKSNLGLNKHLYCLYQLSHNKINLD
jgi:hypothetical protein